MSVSTLVSVVCGNQHIDGPKYGLQNFIQAPAGCFWNLEIGGRIPKYPLLGSTCPY